MTQTSRRLRPNSSAGPLRARGSSAPGACPRSQPARRPARRRRRQTAGRRWSGSACAPRRAARLRSANCSRASRSAASATSAPCSVRWCSAFSWVPSPGEPLGARPARPTPAGAWVQRGREQAGGRLATATARSTLREGRSRHPLGRRAGALAAQLLGGGAGHTRGGLARSSHVTSFRWSGRPGVGLHLLHRATAAISDALLSVRPGFVGVVGPPARRGARTPEGLTSLS